MNREQYKNRLRELLKQLLETSYKAKGGKRKICEAVKDNQLAVSRAYMGTEYKKADHKIMIIGRAMNGWGEHFNSETTDEIIEKIIHPFNAAEQPFDDIVKSKGVEYEVCENGQKKKYFYSRSRFWKLIKQLLVDFGEEKDSVRFYDCDNKWHQKIVWSNLYKISPKDYGNPGTNLIRAQIDACAELLKLEIKYYAPEYILFVTDDWYSETADDGTSPFKEIINDDVKLNDCSDEIVACCMYNGAKVIVCKRPDRKGMTDEKIKTMAGTIHNAYKQMGA